GPADTFVAISAMLCAVEAAYQAAFMAPTQILAEQHYEVLRRWLEPLGVHIALRTAARQEESGPLPLFSRDDAYQIIVGTHALLYESVSFSNLGLAVVYEEQKFRVEEGAGLTARVPGAEGLGRAAAPMRGR